MHIICSQRPMCKGNQQALGCYRTHRLFTSAGSSASSVEKYHYPICKSSPYQVQLGIHSRSYRYSEDSASWRTGCLGSLHRKVPVDLLFGFQGTAKWLFLGWNNPFTYSEFQGGKSQPKTEKSQKYFLLHFIQNDCNELNSF